MSKRIIEDINSTTTSKKRRLASLDSGEKENLFEEEDSGLGPEIDHEDNSKDKMATSFRSQNSHFALYNPNQRLSRSLSLQNPNKMNALFAHRDDSKNVFDKFLFDLSRRLEKIHPLPVPNISVLNENALDDELFLNLPSMEVDEEDTGFQSTQASDNFDIDEVIETLNSPQINEGGDSASKDSPRKDLSPNIENGDESMITSSQEVPQQSTDSFDNEPLPYALFDTSTTETIERENDNELSTISLAEKPKKKRRRTRMRFTHVKKHTKTPVPSQLEPSSWKPTLSAGRELIVRDISMPKEFLRRLHKDITKKGLINKIIINYYGRDQMAKHSLKNPKNQSSDGSSFLLVTDNQVQDIIDLYCHYAPLLNLTRKSPEFRKVRQEIGRLCSIIRPFY